MMKNIIKSIVLAFLLVLTFSQVGANMPGDPITEMPYCPDGTNCGYKDGIDLVKDVVTDIETDKTLSEYIQDVVKYLLGFVTLVGVLYIIYAGFKILVGNGNEDSLKKSKGTILYVAIGIVVMWLAYPIVSWLIDLLDKSSSSVTP